MKQIALCLVFIAIIVFGLVPPVWDLTDRVHVTRWDKLRGEEVVAIGPHERGWLSIGQASRNVLWAMVVAEDSRFYQHHGVDLREIWNSFLLNFQEGRIVRGGSTITQQVVKLTTLGREKTILRKIREAIGALVLECILDKDSILEWYINLVDFGGGVYGLKSAAEYYFETPALHLNVSQSVNLAVVLPSPNSRSQALRNRALTQEGKRRFVHVLKELVANKYITDAQMLEALRTGDFGEPVIGIPEI